MWPTSHNIPRKSFGSILFFIFDPDRPSVKLVFLGLRIEPLFSSSKVRRFIDVVLFVPLIAIADQLSKSGSY